MLIYESRDCLNLWLLPYWSHYSTGVLTTIYDNEYWANNSYFSQVIQVHKWYDYRPVTLLYSLLRMRNICVEIPNYCDNLTAPILTYANYPTPVTTVFSSTFFTCNYGYITSGVSSPPFYTCEPLNTINGFWSAINYSCIGELPICYKLQGQLIFQQRR